MKKKWIAGAVKNMKKGALHKMLGVSSKKKIGRKKLLSAAHSKNPLERKRAQFALNMQGK